MTRSYVLGVSLGLGALAAASASWVQPAPLAKYIGSLQKAESLKVAFSVQTLGGGPAEQFTLTLQKPNLARIEKPGATIVADGAKITFYDKKEEQYYSRNQTAAELNALFDTDEMRIWSPFFNAKAFEKAPAKAEAPVTRKGLSLGVVKVPLDAQTAKVMTLYYAQTDGVARQATFDMMDKGVKTTRLIDTLSVVVNQPAAKELYVWSPPAGSKEVKEEDLVAAKWVTSLDEAIELATKSKRRIMVHFTADWCTWCRKIESEVYSTAEFKEMGKYFVFCQIDTDEQKGLASEFGVSGIPDIRFLEADGRTEVHKVVGYKPKAEFLAEMRKAIKTQ